MDKNDPLLWAAMQVHSRLAAAQAAGPGLMLRSLRDVSDCHELLAANARRLQRAHRHGWHLASQRLREACLTQARGLQSYLRDALAAWGQPPRQPPALSFLLAELRQIEEEFGDVTVRRKEHRIAATTPPIVLKDLSLGRFSIELHLSCLAERTDASCFECVALDPNPAAGNSDITHPHVKDTQLCPGDAAVPIAEALKDGRLADAFCLIRSVLSEYNQHSAYVPLEAWGEGGEDDGQTCSDCDRWVSSDEAYYCEGCSREFCDSCIGTCDLCEEHRCSRCLEVDPVSGHSCCESCRGTCKECGRVVEEDSFDSDSGLCPECLAQHKEQPHEQANASQPAPAAA